MGASVTVAGTVAVVVGGTSGLGRGIARGFAEDGAHAVVPTSRTESAVADTADEIRERGAESLERTCDVTDRASVEALCDAVVDKFGRVDVLVNSAGAIARSTIEEVTEAEWDHVTSVQFDGVYRTMQVFADAMDEGAIVNVSSISGRVANPEQIAYSAAKGGVDSLTRAAATELGPDIRVNAIRPGFFVTPQTADEYDEESRRVQIIEERSPLGRMGTPEELVGAAIYLASDAASYTTGEILTVDGGFCDATF
ncbi:SDR family NAD(P)-dependent oxidoreductase [Halospeciosus flavus]|uniref:SDR family NAD(P)-dependent oxidoreductase n=1 Tax=Halospeciosus flavus TaxID=3032283 RepID=A0ABD5Z926_9EURY|nr:SDR family oxidoreductase [Halospeciosus flavus]